MTRIVHSRALGGQPPNTIGLPVGIFPRVFRVLGNACPPPLADEDVEKTDSYECVGHLAHRITSGKPMMLHAAVRGNAEPVSGSGQMSGT